MADTNLIPLVRKNLLTFAQAAVGTTLFQHTYVFNKRDGSHIDTMQGGRRSCAAFVSVVLSMVWLIDRPHSTVATTLDKMLEVGWHDIDEPLPGSVVLWPEDKDGHKHIGFVIDEKTCISNSSEVNTPQRHGHVMSDGRTPIAYYWHPKLDDPTA